MADAVRGGERPGKTILFFYGTLKRDMPQNYLLKGQEFLAEAATIAQYRLYDLGPYPGLVHAGPTEGLAVQGELWAVDDAMLPKLDEYEGAPELFVREDVVIQHHFEPVQAYFYNGTVPADAAWGERWPLPA
jgi:gamma-glutamylaminecyclotransferase